ncbi:MAG: hypothetical protein CL878_12325 [Dehalococcoidia bacterium]|nr:hypothetical protein [Dehalococcoidia bacterium]
MVVAVTHQPDDVEIVVAGAPRDAVTDLPRFEIVAQPLTPEAFAPFGRAYVPPSATDEVADHWPNKKQLGGIDHLWTGDTEQIHEEIAIVGGLPQPLFRTNRHLNFGQVFRCLQGWFGVVVADPKMSHTAFDPGGHALFVAPPGSVVQLDRLTWHVEPCALAPGGVLSISQSSGMYTSNNTVAIEDLGKQALIRLTVPPELVPLEVHRYLTRYLPETAAETAVAAAG